MQVEPAELASGQGDGSQGGGYGAWDAYISTSRGFSAFALFVVALVVGRLGAFVGVLLHP
jgi:hypothetical protein